jgi:hypothetical protein
MLVNNAGYGYRGAVEDASEAEIGILMPGRRQRSEPIMLSKHKAIELV